MDCDAEAAARMGGVLITDQLRSRITPPPDFRGECAALSALAGALCESPEAVLSILVAQVLVLTKAGSAGVSLLESDASETVFRWRAVGGQYSRYLNGTMPRHASPCGTVIDQNLTLLMQKPVRAFPRISDLHMPIAEVLLVPFYSGATPIGTVWAVMHSEDRRFSSEDERIITSLARFASLAVRNLEDIRMLENASEKLSTESKSKTEFLATLSHELRNPLAPIVNATAALRSLCPDSSRVQASLGIIGRQVQQLNRLIDDLLDVSRAATEKMVLRKAREPVLDFLSLAIETSRPYLDMRKHQFTPELCAATGIELMGDSFRLAQAVSNLLNNASRYTPIGGSITLSVTHEPGVIHISVKDDGVGISSDLIPTIFDMYKQGEGEHHGGLGVGLALVKTIAQLHGGSVTAKSPGPGRGAEFTLSLPVEEPN